MSAKNKALIIGIDEYKNSPLNNCKNDAKEVAAMLSMEEYNFDITAIYDADASRENIKSELYKLFKGDYDKRLFYFAGHGLTNDISTFLITHDYKSYDLGIDTDDIAKLARSVKSGSTIIILDCCQSGGATIRAIDTNINRMTNETLIERFHNIGQGKVILAACQSHEFASEVDTLGHGIFTYFLLQGMVGGASDAEGEVTIGALHEYVAKQMEQYKEQKPVFKGDIAGRLILGSNLSPQERKFVPEEKLYAIEQQAYTYADEYKRLERFESLEHWLEVGYKKACDSLLPKLEWFKNRLLENPELKKRQNFWGAFQLISNELTILGNLQNGLLTKFGRIDKPIGSGTFGTVWIVDNDKKQYAYKLFHSADISNEDKKKRFERGYKAMSYLDHPHIVKVHRYTDCPVGFLMDYINGQNIREFIYNDIPVKSIINILLVIAETLKHAHDREVIHRDVKPENIIISLDYNEKDGDYKYMPYLTDFDLAWFSAATQFTREGLGSLNYAAPEQMSKPNSKIAHAKTTDIYAFGQLAFFLICKHDPQPMSLRNGSILQERLKSWSFYETAKLMFELYQKCTKIDESERYQDFREISDILFEILAKVQNPDHRKIMKLEEFCQQLIFSIIGMLDKRILSERSFQTILGKLQITMHLGDQKKSTNDMHFQIEALSQLMTQSSDYKTSRETINKRIDESLKDFPKAYRRAGQHGLFECFIYVGEIEINIDGVELCRKIITRVIDAIEKYL